MRLSRRRVCKALGLHRPGVRYAPELAARMPEPVRRPRELARRHPRYGYRRITALPRAERWPVNVKRVRRLWRLGGLRIPGRVKKRRRLGHPGNGCTRRTPTRVDEAWGYDLVFDQTPDGRRLEILPVVDDYSRECVAMVVATLAKVAEERGMPGHLRSDNGPESIAQEVREWLAGCGTRTLYIEPGSPRENAYSESFDSRLRDELLSGESFGSLKEAAVLLGQHRRAHNEERPHSSLGRVAPAVFARNHAPPVGAKPRPAGESE